MAVFCRVFLFCRVFFSSLPSVLFSALGKDIGMPSAIILPSVVSEALGKQLFCRVPDKMHSANLLALGKSVVSGSVYMMLEPKENGADDLLFGCLDPKWV